MPQIDISGSDSKLSCDKLQGQSGTTVAIQAGHSISGDGSGLTSLTAGNLVGSLPAISGASLTNLPASGWGFVSQVVSAGASTISFTNMVSGYDYMYITGPMIGTIDTDFWYYLGVAGPTYRTSGYLNGSGNISSGGTSSGTANTTEFMVNNGSGNVGASTDEGIQYMETVLLDPAGTTDTHVHTTCSSRDSAGTYDQCISGGLLNLAEAHTSIRFQFSGGTMTGTILQYRRSRT
jgi:hypothetical protein